MPTKVSATLLGLILAAGVAFGAWKVLEIVTAEHDGWDLFAPVAISTEPVTIEPGNLLRKVDREALEKVVLESHTYGLPWAIHVISDAEVEEGLSAEEIAAQRFEEDPVESREGAADGLLMVVIVPDADHTATETGFANGPNFYPRGGVTPERLDYIANVQMQALIDGNSVGPAVVEGATWVEWAQLFEPTPDPPISNLERGLQDLLVPAGAAGIAVLAMVIAILAAAVAFLTWQGRGAITGVEVSDAVLAAAHRGRVDRGVLTGGVLDAIDRGALLLDNTGALHATPQATSARDRSLASMIDAIEQRGGTPTTGQFARHLATDGTPRRLVEDELASAGFFHPKSQVFTITLRWTAIAGMALGAIALVISVMGEAPPALLASIALAGTSLIVQIWNERRSWTTRAGRRALRAWREDHDEPGDRDRALFDAIVDMETVDLVPLERSPLRPGARTLAAQLNS